MKRTEQAKSRRQATPKNKPQPQRAESPDFITDLAATAGPAGAAPGGTRLEKRSLGDRIREVREIRGLTREDLSSRSGISVESLERVESNRAIPPLGDLVRLGKALEMKMGYFISTGADRPVSVVRAESRPKVARHGKQLSDQHGYVYESLAPEKANRLMEPFLVTLMPTEFEVPSRHDGQEFLFVLEGEIRVKVDKHVEVLRPGDSVYYDSSHPHLVKCCGDRPAKIVAVIHAGTK